MPRLLMSYDITMPPRDAASAPYVDYACMITAARAAITPRAAIFFFRRHVFCAFSFLPAATPMRRLPII